MSEITPTFSRGRSAVLHLGESLAKALAAAADATPKNVRRVSTHTPEPFPPQSWFSDLHFQILHDCVCD
jgi:hypothetical protein